MLRRIINLTSSEKTSHLGIHVGSWESKGSHCIHARPTEGVPSHLEGNQMHRMFSLGFVFLRYWCLITLCVRAGGNSSNSRFHRWGNASLSKIWLKTNNWHDRTTWKLRNCQIFRPKWRANFETWAKRSVKQSKWTETNPKKKIEFPCWLMKIMWCDWTRQNWN